MHRKRITFEELKMVLPKMKHDSNAVNKLKDSKDELEQWMHAGYMRKNECLIGKFYSQLKLRCAKVFKCIVNLFS